MEMDELSALWAAYRSRQVDMTIHPDDHMFKSGGHSLSRYRWIGESAAGVICSVLGAGPTESVKSILDFGCGHGRVARHLRALFPTARLVFSDIDDAAAAFCAQQFRGETATSAQDFPALTLPRELDLIWVGSVFTHIDAGRMRQLYDALFRCLARDGLLIATFHGHWTIAAGLLRKWVSPEQSDRIQADFAASGVGHEAYEGALGEHGWGISVTDIAWSWDLGDGQQGARKVAAIARGWADHHDVCSWARVVV